MNLDFADHEPIPPARFDDYVGMLAVRKCYTALGGRHPEWASAVLRDVVAAVDAGDVLPEECSGPDDPRCQRGAEWTLCGPVTVGTVDGLRTVSVGLLRGPEAEPRWIAVDRPAPAPAGERPPPPAPRLEAPRPPMPTLEAPASPPSSEVTFLQTLHLAISVAILGFTLLRYLLS